MRFKKLRITLGVTIAIFILVVADILIFGGFGANVNAIPKYNSQILKVGQNKVVTQNTASTTNNQNTAPAVQETVPTPTIVHTFRTRAS